MQYMRSLQFIQDRKNWMMNILWIGLCLMSGMIIPIIGQLIMMGYFYIMIESLHKDPEHRDYPDFDINRFTEYLSRGVWPFLVSLIVGVVMMVPIMIGYFLGFVVAMAAAKDAPFLIILFYFVFVVVVIALAIAATLISWPASLYAGLSRGFDFKGMVGFVKDFNNRVLKELIYSLLFLIAAGIVAELVGCIALCVGIFFTMAAVQMAQHHLQFQLYELYLQRGGTQIPLAASSSSPPPPPRDDGAPDERFRAAP